MSRWFDTYGDDILGKDTPEMEKAVEEYSLRRHEGSSEQNREELARWQEENYEMVSEYRFLDPKEYKDIKPRIGRILGYDEFISILRNDCGLTCFYREMGHPQKLALWVKRSSISPDAECACWIQRPFMIEYEVPSFDSKDLPTGTRFRGWRTCLLQMRIKDMITEERINKVFGQATGPASARYLRTMQSLRNNYGLV